MEAQSNDGCGYEAISKASTIKISSGRNAPMMNIRCIKIKKKNICGCHKKMEIMLKKKDITGISILRIHTKPRYVINHDVKKHEYQEPAKSNIVIWRKK